MSPMEQPDGWYRAPGVEHRFPSTDAAPRRGLFRADSGKLWAVKLNSCGDIGAFPRVTPQTSCLMPFSTVGRPCSGLPDRDSWCKWSTPRRGNVDNQPQNQGLDASDAARYSASLALEHGQPSTRSTDVHSEGLARGRGWGATNIKAASIPGISQ